MDMDMDTYVSRNLGNNHLRFICCVNNWMHAFSAERKCRTAKINEQLLSWSISNWYIKSMHIARVKNGKWTMWPRHSSFAGARTLEITQVSVCTGKWRLLTLMWPTRLHRSRCSFTDSSCNSDSGRKYRLWLRSPASGIILEFNRI